MNGAVIEYPANTYTFNSVWFGGTRGYAVIMEYIKYLYEHKVHISNLA